MSTRPLHRRERGFSAILMLALIVLMGGMLGYAATVTSAMGDSAAQEISQERMRQAALAGLEWGRYRIEANPAAGTDDLALPFTTGVVTVTVRRTLTSPSPYNEGGPVSTYVVSATACWPAPSGRCPDATPAPGYVQRVVTGIVAR